MRKKRQDREYRPPETRKHFCYKEMSENERKDFDDWMTEQKRKLRGT
jgi:hypothetical protein